MSTEEGVTGRLENWCYDPHMNVVWGELYEDIHKRWNEGTRIHTSTLKKPAVACLGRGIVIETTNSSYLLGERKLSE